MNIKLSSRIYCGILPFEKRNDGKIPERVRDDVSLSLRGVCRAHDVVISFNSKDFEITSGLLLHISQPCDCHGLASLTLAMTEKILPIL